MSSERSRITVYGRESEASRNYWVEKLAREAGPSNLILDYERSNEYSYEAGSVEIVLPEDLLQKLIALTKDSSFLIYTILLAALNVCLHKYTGSSSIVIGSPSRKQNNGGMPRPNALAIVNDIDASLSVRQLLLNM